MISKSQGETEFSLDLESDRVEIRNTPHNEHRVVWATRPCVFGANDSIQDTYRKIDQLLTDPQSSYKPDLEKSQFDTSIYPQ